MLIDFDILTVGIALVIYVIICAWNRKKHRAEKVFYIFSMIMFVYLLCVIKITLFPIVLLDGMPSNIATSVNFVPFKGGINMTDIQNLIMTIPLGVGIPFVSKIKDIKKIMLLGIFMGICIEGLQYLESFISHGFTFRIIDINDVICNFLGTIIGFLILWGCSRLYLRLKKENLNNFWKYIYQTCSELRL